MGLPRKLFGELRWTPPNWARNNGGRRFLSITSIVAVFAAIALAGYLYYQSLPKPPQVHAAATAPAITPLVEDERPLQPHPLVIDFEVKADPRNPMLTVDSVARLDLIGKEITEGITIEPAMAGQWTWQSETQIRFAPASDWPAGQKYTVRYAPTLFAAKLEFADHEVSFKTPEFSVALESLEFYQDPVEQAIRKVVATINFTHPVDSANLDKLLSLAMRESGATVDTEPQPIGYSTSYANHQRTAYVQSVPIEIPQHESYMTLRLKKNLKPHSGPSRATGELLENVNIPDIKSYFRVSNTDSMLVRDEDDIPLQTVSMAFTDYVNIQNLQQRIKVWVLPVQIEINGSMTTQNFWQSPRQVSTEVLRQAREIKVELNAVGRDSAKLHSFTTDVPQNRQLYVLIAEGLRSEGGYEMGLPYDTIIRAPEYPKEVTIAQTGAILPLTGSHQLTFVSRGVDTLKIELGRVIDTEVNHLASQSGGDISNPYFQNYNFSKENLTTSFTRYVELNAGHPRGATYSNLDLSEYLPDGGYYFVSVQGWDKVNKHAIGQSDTRFILITDLGLLIKTNADSSQQIFVHSIASGKPVGGVTVDLLGKNGVTLFSRRTSADGHTSMPALKNLQREKAPTVFIARHGQDAVFMPYQQNTRRLQYSRFDVGGERTSEQLGAGRLRAQLFTERDLYRPGDTTYLAAIVKRDDWGTLSQLPLILSVNDPRGRRIMDKRLQMPPDGFIEDALTTDAAAPTGAYTATLYLVENSKRRRAIGSHTFKVEEFQPDRLKIRSEIVGQKPRGWLKPDALLCTVSLHNLFGTPAENRRILANYQLSPSTIHIAGYKDYQFIDPLRRRGQALHQVQQSLPETVTDKDGNASLPLPLGSYDKGIYRLSVFTEGFEQGGGRSVRAVASTMLSPLDYLVGVKTDGSLHYIKKDSERQLQLVAVDSDARAVALGNLKLALFEERYVSTLVQRANGTFAYQSILKESLVSEQPFEIGTTGTSYNLPTAQAGRFRARLTDSAGLIYSDVFFVVAGERNLTANLEKNAELGLVINGSNFSPGDEIEMEITAPYTGSGLITIERDKVLAWQWFHSTTTTSVQRITVPAGLEGNAYVNVTYVRDLGSPEIFVSPLSYAVAPFSTNRDARTVGIDLQVAERVKPGEDLAITYSASKPSRIIVYAVDEGILQVAKYQQPDPLAFFLRKMALQVSTFQLADLILPEFEAYQRSAAPGGGEGAALLGQNLNPFRRKTDAPVVFWSGIIDAGPEAQTITYATPDYFNGQLRIMAIAVSDHAAGHSKAEAVVRAPFVITPNVLTAAAPGDEFDVNVGLANALEDSGANTAIRLSASPSSHLEIIGARDIKLEIDEGREKRAQFRVRAKHQLGAASIQFTATSGETSASLQATLSIRPSVPFVATMAAGVASDDPLVLSFSRTLYDEFAEQAASASTSPLILVDGLLDYLKAFPHQCAEQIVSKVFPQIGFLGNRDYTVDEKSIRDVFARTVQTLRSRQGDDGGFRFWMSSPEAAPFPSVYIMHFLTDANVLGLAVPRDLQRAGLEYLRRIASAEVKTLVDARLRAYAIYVLTRNSTVTTNYLTNLHEYLERDHRDLWRKDLLAAYMASSYTLLKIPKLGQDLIDQYEMGGGNEMVSDFDTRLGRDAQFVYLLARHFPERLSVISGEDIRNLTAPIMQNRFNTLSSAYTVMALNAYTRSVFAAQGAPQLRIDGMSGDTAQQLSDNAVFARTAVSNSLRRVRVSGGGDQNVFHVLSQGGFDRTPPTDALAEGLEIYRQYYDANNQEVSTAQIGQELTVVLRVRSTGIRRSNVAVIDMLPGGFEVLTQSVRDDYDRWRADYRDIREDRVVFYGSFTSSMTEIRYRVKLTSAGDLVVPSAYAGSMYDRSLQARTAPGRFTVTRTP